MLQPIFVTNFTSANVKPIQPLLHPPHSPDVTSSSSSFISMSLSTIHFSFKLNIVPQNLSAADCFGTHQTVDWIQRFLTLH